MSTVDIEQFVETLRLSEQQVRVARLQQERTVAGTAENLRALIDYRRNRDALSMMIADHPDLVARLLVRAWEAAQAVATQAEQIQDIRSHLLGGEALV